MLVQVKQGKISGFEIQSVLSKKPYYAFRGVPYAEPPIGNLRFKSPVPIDSWDGVLEAKSDPDPCIQFDGNNIKGGEDCLFLNVYTPKVEYQDQLTSGLGKKLPVMVYIHGGSFASSSSSYKSYSPDFLMEHNIVFVSLNYRLHALGFLNLKIPSCPGNVGLKDQLLALQWTKENIENFGGDPENITLFGESAGGIAVHLHMISPASRGLFHKIIIQSGLCSMPLVNTTDTEATAFELGQRLGFEGTEKEALLEFLQKQSAEEISRTAHEMKIEIILNQVGNCSLLPFGPSIESAIEGAFLSEPINKLIKSAPNIPTIIGINEKEGTIKVFSAPTPEYLICKLQEDFSSVVKFNFNLDAKDVDDLVIEIKEFYFDNKNLSMDHHEKIIDLFTDLYFMNFYSSLENLIKSEYPVYIYKFSFDGKRNAVKSLYADSKFKGAAHGDELGYLFLRESHGELALYNLSAERRVIENITELWTNFAKTGKPTSLKSEVQWKPCTSGNFCYLEINDGLTLKKGRMFEKRQKFWEKWSKKLKLIP